LIASILYEEETITKRISYHLLCMVVFAIHCYSLTRLCILMDFNGAISRMFGAVRGFRI